jgi:hypothetical protein
MSTPDTPSEVADARGYLTAHVTATIRLPTVALTVVMRPPDTISQINVERELGLPRRTYLELLREPDCPLDVTCVGKIRLVDRDKFRSWLMARDEAKRAAAAAVASEAAPAAADDDQLTVEEQAKLGIKPAPRTPQGRR